MPKPDTLIILSPGFPVNEADSTCLPLQQILIRTIYANYPELNIIVLAFEYPFTRKPHSWFGIEVIAFDGRNRSRGYRLLNWLRIWRQLQKLKKQHKIIGLLSFWVDECAFIGHYFAKLNSINHFSWILGQDAKPGNRYFKWMKMKGEELIALSDFVRRSVYQNYGVMPAHVITPGINTELFKPSEQQRWIDVLGVGSLIALKQYDVFIEVIKGIAKTVPDVKAVICGTGPEKENLIKLITKSGLGNNIVLRYEVAHTEVLSLMQQSKVFLHPSAYEGFGAVILEALYAGAHVVSFVKPMDKPSSHHYIVNDIEEMCAAVLAQLVDENRDNEPVLVYPIEDVADSIMALFTSAPTQSALFVQQSLR